MFINQPAKQIVSANVSTSKKSYLLALVLAATTLAGLSATTMTTQAAGLGELFNNNSAEQSKFLPVGKAFQVSNNAKATTKGTSFSINFNITPGHYVYKDRLTLTFPAGVSATPFTFSQSPVSINDPTFGRVPVFTQKNMVATTTLTSTNGKAIKNAAVTIGWQGCAKAGLCYPPEKIKTTVNIAASAR